MRILKIQNLQKKKLLNYYIMLKKINVHIKNYRLNIMFRRQQLDKYLKINRGNE